MDISRREGIGPHISYVRPNACLQPVTGDELCSDFTHRSGVEHDCLQTRKLESCADRVSARTATYVEHNLVFREINDLRPGQRRCHAGAVHRLGEEPCEFGLLSMRLKHFLATGVCLGGVRSHRLFQFVQ